MTLKQAYERGEFSYSQGHMALINELLPLLDFEEGYRLGIASAAAAMAGLTPTKEFLREIAVDSTSLADAIARIDAWIRKQTKSRRAK